MPRPVNLKDLPEHPAIDTSEIAMRRMYGHSVPCALVTCSTCGVKRWYPLGTLRQWIKRGSFTGACRGCWSSRPKLRTFRSARNPAGRRVTRDGYVVLTQNAIDHVDMHLFDAMRASAGFVAEHRWVMAKYLDRALTSDELVDHMDGNKQNNNVDNLRLYVRGKQQQGSAPGHGTYYHEWQMAERRIRELEQLLAERQ